MINLTKISTVYFIGIGGIGMSALARYFNHSGKQVFGYDRTRTALCQELEKEGITINYADSLDNMEKNADLVVYTPAIPKDHIQFNWYVDAGYTVAKRAAVLGAITKDKFCIAVAGSHGKTTVSTMIAHLLHRTLGCTAFLGGIASNYQSNYLFSKSKYVVVEADEYDRSFMTLSPNMIVVTSIDSDHLEIYGSLENIEKEFVEFMNLIHPEGTILLNDSLGHLEPKLRDIPSIKKYGKRIDSDYQLNDYRIAHALYHFSVDHGKEKVEDLAMQLGGLHNLLNTTAAIAVCKELGVSNDDIRAGLLEFKGIKRRLEKHIDTAHLSYFDDYAHHPSEVKALLSALRELYPSRKITAIFQPHLFSRTKELANDFAEALSLADQVLLLPIYPARELPIEGVTSALISSEMIKKSVRLVAHEQVLDELKREELDVVVTLGAGNIDTLVGPIKTFFTNKIKAI